MRFTWPRLAHARSISHAHGMHQASMCSNRAMLLPKVCVVIRTATTIPGSAIESLISVAASMFERCISVVTIETGSANFALHYFSLQNRFCSRHRKLNAFERMITSWIVCQVYHSVTRVDSMGRSLRRFRRQLSRWEQRARDDIGLRHAIDS